MSTPSKMRVDRFLKLARLVKRRTLAKELCDDGVVFVNGVEARAGRSVGVGDRVLLRLRNRRLEVEVSEVPVRAPSASRARDLYRILNDERVDPDAEEGLETDPARDRDPDRDWDRDQDP